jgi:ElaB/YqjD/DUF883 family membrane-anchored ribosome-binding protein
MSTNESTGGDASLTAQAQEKVQQTAQQASSTAARYVREQTETRGQQVATELQHVAGALRRSSHALHADGHTQAGQSIEMVTDRIEGLRRYLGGTGGDQMLRDLESFGRRKPWGMIGLGMGVGIAASRVLKASSSRRFEPQQSAMIMPAAPAYDGTPPEHVTGEIPVVQARGF